MEDDSGKVILEALHRVLEMQKGIKRDLALAREHADEISRELGVRIQAIEKWIEAKEKN